MIRYANENDSLGIGKVYCRSWKEAYKGIIPQAFLDSLTSKEQKISVKNNIVYEDNSEIVGIVNFGMGRDAEIENIGEIRSIYVLPEYWSCGIGKKLFKAASDRLKNEGYTSFYLWVLDENKRAKAFYERMGMYITNETRNINISGKDLREIKYNFVFK